MLNDGWKKTSNTPEETALIGKQLAKTFSVGDIICFFGELGVGKTTLIKTIAHTLLSIPPHTVNSPTFTYLNIYEGSFPLFHFDLYRLKTAEEFFQRGFHDYFEAGGICLVEWPERLGPLLPKQARCFELKHLGSTKRTIYEKEKPL